MKDKYTINKLSRLYFSKNVLPFWCVLLMDTIIVFLSCLFAYWVSNRTGNMYANRFSVLYTALLFSVFSWVGARLFKTYSGVVRYSSFVDLMKVAYANVVTLVLALICTFVLKDIGVPTLTALSSLETIAAIAIATLLMWGIRVIVKILFDASNAKDETMRAIIYGALTGGIGIAKNIRAQNPRRFTLCGFISHDRRMRDMSLMGVPVYTLDDDIVALIEKEHIQAVLVSPLRVEEFRKNQKLQDIFISAGCKIFMAQEAREASIKNGELGEEEVENMQLHEVSVEELLPRQEIKVDLKAVGELLEGRRVLITGAAGSIGSEMVRQVALFKPAKMMLIDQAETPQHDIELMMARDFPDVPCEVIVTSISRRTRMEYIFDTFRPEYVFHAAAYKHVPMMENNPSEAVINNI